MNRCSRGLTLRVWGLAASVAGVSAAALLSLAAGGETIDYAEAQHAGDWLRHPVYGDPSFDAFERAPGNPIHRGAPPFEWPVNGFLFVDPNSQVAVEHFRIGGTPKPAPMTFFVNGLEAGSWRGEVLEKGIPLSK